MAISSIFNRRPTPIVTTVGTDSEEQQEDTSRMNNDTSSHHRDHDSDYDNDDDDSATQSTVPLSTTSSMSIPSPQLEAVNTTPASPFKSNQTVSRKKGRGKLANNNSNNQGVVPSLLPLFDRKDSNLPSSSTMIASLFHAKGNASTKAFVSCALYSFCSVSMVLSNKSLTTSGIDLNILLVVFQALVAVICVESCKYWNVIESYKSFDMTIAIKWAPVNIFFCCMLFTGMQSLQYNSVPMVTIFKNVTNIAVAIGDYCFYNTNTNDPLIILSFIITLAGAIAASYFNTSSTTTNDNNDPLDSTAKSIQIEWLGLFWMVMNCVSTAGYVLYMKFATNTVKLSKFGMVYYNNILCLLFLLPVATITTNQFHLFSITTELHSWKYLFQNIFAGFMGFFLNFASLNCVSHTGPTTYAVIGSINKIPVAFIGYFLFDNRIKTETWVFIIISLCGGFLYSYAKIRTPKPTPSTSTTAVATTAATTTTTGGTKTIVNKKKNDTDRDTMNGTSSHGNSLNSPKK